VNSKKQIPPSPWVRSRSTGASLRTRSFDSARVRTRTWAPPNYSKWWPAFQPSQKMIFRSGWVLFLAPTSFFLPFAYFQGYARVSVT
jgi:hypothetical protein